MSLRNPIRLSFAALVAACFALCARAEIKVGDTFPALAPVGLVNLAGGDVPAMNGKVTLVDFWASWCAPCKASFPAMAKLHAEYAPRGLQILAVSVDEKPNAAVAFWKKMAPPFTALHDHDLKLINQVGVPTMPSSYLVDRAGHVRYVHAGYQGDLTELRKEIDSLLAEKS